ncbi:hypothetical protein [Shimia sp.]
MRFQISRRGAQRISEGGRTSVFPPYDVRILIELFVGYGQDDIPNHDFNE